MYYKSRYQTCLQNSTAIHSIAIEIFLCGTKWWTGRHWQPPMLNTLATEHLNYTQQRLQAPKQQQSLSLLNFKWSNRLQINIMIFTRWQKEKAWKNVDYCYFRAIKTETMTKISWTDWNLWTTLKNIYRRSESSLLTTH